MTTQQETMTRREAELLLDYGRHVPSCPFEPVSRDCDCGFTDLLEQARLVIETAPTDAPPAGATEHGVSHTIDGNLVVDNSDTWNWGKDDWIDHYISEIRHLCAALATVTEEWNNECQHADALAAFIDTLRSYIDPNMEDADSIYSELVTWKAVHDARRESEKG